MKSLWEFFISEVQEWCVGKQWWWRALVLAWFGWTYIGYLGNPSPSNVFGPFNLAIHEMGHLIFGWCGMFIGIAGGTINQILFPVLGMWNFYVQKDFFALSLCFGWLSTNLFNVAVYMADARSMELPLVSIGGGDAMHDWNYLLGRMGLLNVDHALAGFVALLAHCAMLVCFIAGGWMLWQMATIRRTA